MCGLSAIVDFKPGNHLIQDLLAMHERIPYRGPDGKALPSLMPIGVPPLHGQSPNCLLRRPPTCV